MLCDVRAEPERQDNGETGQDVCSPAKKMRMGSGLAQARDTGMACFCFRGMESMLVHVSFKQIPNHHSSLVQGT